MNIDEVRAIRDRAPRIHKPKYLKERWWERSEEVPSVERFVAAARAAVHAPQLDDPATAAAYVAWMMEGLLQPFQRLIESGKLDEALPRLPALPILYSPSSTGADKWEYAKALYERKRVGADCMLEDRQDDCEVARNPLWRLLAYDTIQVVQEAALRMPVFRALREKGTPRFKITKKLSKAARLAFEAQVFLLPNDELLEWPDWLDACGAIPLREKGGCPVSICEAETAYSLAARAVLNNFFADPDHPYAEQIVAQVTGVRSELPRAQAVAEARKYILDAVLRF